MFWDNSTRFRLSALVPFALSAIAFALVLVLVLSGTNPNLVPDGYLIRLNTTSVGQNLIELNPATPATTATSAANVGRDVRSVELSNTKTLRAVLSSLLSSRSIITNSSVPSSTTSNSSLSCSSNFNSSISTSPNVNVSISSTSNSNSTSSTAPTLVIPQAAVAANPAAIPISLIGTFFQLTLNTLASGMGGVLEGIVSLLVTTEKQSLGVNQYYTMHVFGICEGSGLNANATNSSSSFNITRCVSYNNAGTYIANLTGNVSDSTLVAATNITVPILSKVPGIGRSAKSLIDTISGIVLTVFIICLIGNGLSIVLSAAAFFAPSYGKIHTTAAAITTISTQLLQVAAITSTTIGVSISKAINSYSDVLGLSATVGGKFLALIWVAYITAQAANGYWITSWFVEFRTISYKARQRRKQEMGDYKGIGREILSDMRLQKAEYEDTEVLTPGRNIRHWNDGYKQM